MKQQIETGVLLRTFPMSTMILKLEGEDQLRVLVVHREEDIDASELATRFAAGGFVNITDTKSEPESKSKSSGESVQALAERIATNLFTAGPHGTGGTGKTATRLVLQNDDESDMGGWGYPSVVSQILKEMLLEPGLTSPKS